MDTIKYVLSEDQMPTSWYNIAADLPVPAPPPLHPGTGQPLGPADLAPLFPMELILQEVSTEREIEIPEPVRDIYKLWRPAPLYRAHRLEKALGTPAKIFYKYEGVSPAGSHKPNTAVPQAFYNKEAGVKRLVTETGAGQWGTSLSFAGSLFGLEVEVFQVRVSFDQKPYRRAVMETYGARCIASPSMETVFGRSVLAKNPNHPGSLGIAISEAVELAVQREDTKYALGSVLNHVLWHQTIIGQEAMEQMQMADAWPDVVVGCTGGGSNFAGIAFPFIGHGLRGGAKPRIVAVEPAACPSLTRVGFAGSAIQRVPLMMNLYCCRPRGSMRVVSRHEPSAWRVNGSAPRSVVAGHVSHEPESHTEVALASGSSVASRRMPFASAAGRIVSRAAPTTPASSTGPTVRRR